MHPPQLAFKQLDFKVCLSYFSIQEDHFFVRPLDGFYQMQSV